MLSKEEISKLKINVFNQCDDETIRLVAEMLKHTEQLESDKQKLIEKLEDAIDFTKTSKDLTSKAKIEVLENVLKILKEKKKLQSNKQT